MASFAKAIVIAVLVSVVFLVLTNFIFFFPWYMTLVYETFNLSSGLAQDNYLKKEDVDATLNRLSTKPFFKDYAKDPDYGINIEWVGEGDPWPEGDYYNSDNKPYKQRGTELTVRMTAYYPLKITIAGEEYKRPIKVSFQMSTMGLRYYKDLEIEGN